jgi:hypothetical protein
MAYLGTTPAVGYSKIEKQTITGNDGTTYTLNNPVGNEQEIEVYVNNVRQEPGNAYTTFGTTLNMTGVVTANDSFYVVYQSKAERTLSIIPEQDSKGHYNFDSGTLYIDSTNNRIGINNTSPSQALTVTGNVSVSGNLTVGTGTVIINDNSISVNGGYISPVQSFRNKVINGNFDYWQRGTSNTSIATGQYLADRWLHFRVGSTANVSRQAFTLGQTDVPNEPTYFHRTIVTSSAGASNRCDLRQNIESVRTLAGQTAILSFWAKADASKNIAVEFQQSFGTGGSPSSGVNAIGVTTCALTTSWKKFTIPVNIPSISGKTLGTDNNDILTILLWFDAGSTYNSRTNSLGQQSGTFDIAQVQLEAGSVATPFEVRPLGTELQLCQRYFCKTFPLSTAPGDNRGVTGCIIERTGTFSTGTALSTRWQYPVAMRAAPTITLYNVGTGTSGFWKDAFGVNTVYDPSTPAASDTSMYLASATTAGTTLTPVIHVVASAEL